MTPPSFTEVYVDEERREACYRGIRASLLRAMGIPPERGEPAPAANPVRIRRLAIEREGPTGLRA